jgi:hypothetical protein
MACTATNLQAVDLNIRCNPGKFTRREFSEKCPVYVAFFRNANPTLNEDLLPFDVQLNVKPVMERGYKITVCEKFEKSCFKHEYFNNCSNQNI